MTSSGINAAEVQPQKRKRITAPDDIADCKKVRLTENTDYSNMIKEVDNRINTVETELIELEAALGIEVHPFIFEAMNNCISRNDEPKIIIKGLEKIKEDVDYRLHHVSINQLKTKVQDNLYLKNKFWLKEQSLLKTLRILENHINNFKLKIVGKE